MPRTFVRKTQRCKTSSDLIMRAINDVIDEKKSVRSVAEKFNINHVTLTRYVKKKRSSTTENITFGYIRNRMIFTVEQESEIETYLKTAASIFFGLTPLDVRKLSYEYALVLTIDVPESWRYSKIAGADWFYGFLKRHPGLSIRQPEATSLARATSFNQHNVENFYTKLDEVTTRYKLETQDIWNIDETGVTTVQKPRCIVASKVTKQVGALTSGERD